MVIGMYSCKEEQQPSSKISDTGGIEVVISHSAGDDWAPSDNFLPLPFNVADLGNDETIILANRIKKGEKLEVKAIGAVRVSENDTLNTYIISIPVKSKYKSFAVSDFDEFSTVHSGAKWIIEQYMLNRKNSPSVRLKSWENENFAIKYLLK